MKNRRDRLRPGGLYVLTDERMDEQRTLDTVRAALAGGARMLQYRRKHVPRPKAAAEAARLRELCHADGALFIVNDDLALAADTGADGVHLGRDDPPVSEARRVLGSDAIVGVSCYGELERGLDAACSGADYVAFGSFFPSTTKPHAPRASLELLARARSRLDLPIVAIGGIRVEHAPSLIAAGADWLAVIDAVFGSDDPEAAARGFTRLFETGAARPAPHDPQRPAR